MIVCFRHLLFDIALYQFYRTGRFQVAIQVSRLIRLSDVFCFVCTASSNLWQTEPKLFSFSQFFCHSGAYVVPVDEIPLLDKAKTILIFVFGDAVKTIKSIQAENVSRID